ncbi:hypothetical protein SRDD_02390 [Serratia sp. DD3]|nr:hypothetical protein SRDD_02390 [Serratia sp. DD3]
MLLKPGHQAVEQHLLFQCRGALRRHPAGHRTGCRRLTPHIDLVTRHGRLPHPVTQQGTPRLTIEYQRHAMPGVPLQLADLPTQHQQVAGQRLALRVLLRTHRDHHCQLAPPVGP